jgi:hypothetical protein
MPIEDNRQQLHASAPTWRGSLRIVLIGSILFGLLIYSFILIVDPYQNVPFSPQWQRAPIDTNQRFSYPAIARSDNFDSVVLGTSTSRMLDPVRLDELFGARFANLSMNSATAWEQRQIGLLFLRHHPETRYLLLGIDTVWCETGVDYDRYTFRLFPEWMYDENPWNDLLYLFNDKALEQAVRQVQYLSGSRGGKYEANGFRDFLPADSAWDAAKARKSIYGNSNFDRSAATPIPETRPASLQPQAKYPAHQWLVEMLDAAAPDTIKILFFVPYHENILRSQAAHYADCKWRVLEIAAGHKNTHVVDFMRPSILTGNDANYWDSLHYKREVARKLEELLAGVATGNRNSNEFFDYLTPITLRKDSDVISSY